MERLKDKRSYTECVCCNEPFDNTNVFTLEGARETQISGMCEKCFDSVTEEKEDE